MGFWEGSEVTVDDILKFKSAHQTRDCFSSGNSILFVSNEGKRCLDNFGKIFQLLP